MVKFLTEREGEMLRGGERPSPELKDRILTEDRRLMAKIMGNSGDIGQAIVRNILSVHPQGRHSVLL